MFKKHTLDRTTGNTLTNFFKKKKKVVTEERSHGTTDVDISIIEGDRPDLKNEWQNRINALVESDNSLVGKGTPIIGVFNYKIQRFIIFLIFLLGLTGLLASAYFYYQNKETLYSIDRNLTSLGKNITLAMISMDGVITKDNTKLVVAQEALSNLNREFQNFDNYLTLYNIDSEHVIRLEYQKLGQKISWINDVYRRADTLDVGAFAPYVKQVLDMSSTDINNLYKTTQAGELKLKFYPLISLGVGIFCLLLSIWLLISMYYTIRYNDRLFFEEGRKKEEFELLPLLNDLNKISNGNLKVELTPSGKLLGAIAGGINVFVKNVSKIIKNLKTNSAQIQQRINEVEELSIRLSDTNEQQEKNILKSESVLQGIHNSLDKIVKRAASCKVLSNESAKNSLVATNDIAELIKIIKDIEIQVSQTNDAMQRISKFSKNISDVADILYDINAETAVLAHNATIQSSKTGQGNSKGFQIISSAIQELSNKALAATKRVEELSNVMQENIKDAEGYIGKTLQEVNGVVVLSEGVGASLGRLRNNLAQLNTYVEEVYNDSKKQFDISFDINKNMVDLKQTSMLNKDSISRNSNALLKVNEALRNMESSVEKIEI